MTETISASAARRIALAAQGFGAPRLEGPCDYGHIRRTLARTQLLQIDSVNILARAHYMPLYSRLGPYDRTVLEKAAWHKPRRLFEYWGHEASLLPLDLQPLFRWRMEEADRGIGTWGQMKPFAGERRPEALRLLELIREEGPRSAGDIDRERAGRETAWWGWSDTKSALEWLFWSGRITTRTRRGTFERVYDLTERVIPAAIQALPTPDKAEAHRILMARAAASLGIATLGDLRDYFRLKPAPAEAALRDLLEDGTVTPVEVKGWRNAAYLHRDARRARKIEARALLSPFDPVVWERSRTERLFGVRYRIEIYTPAEQRQHGYYVLPFLLGDTLAARVDLKADRARGVLMVPQAHAEPKAPPHVAEALADELATLAAWLGLEQIEIGVGGDLAPALAAAAQARKALPAILQSE